MNNTKREAWIPNRGWGSMNNTKRRKHVRNLGPPTMVDIHSFLTYLLSDKTIAIPHDRLQGDLSNNVYQEQEFFFIFRSKIVVERVCNFSSKNCKLVINFWLWVYFILFVSIIRDFTLVIFLTTCHHICSYSTHTTTTQWFHQALPWFICILDFQCFERYLIRTYGKKSYSQNRWTMQKNKK